MKKQIYIVEIDMPDGDLVSSGWLQDLIQQDLDSEGDKNRQTVSVRAISLPSDLDEAMRKYGHEHPILPEYYNDGEIPLYESWTAEAFKAGAEWMAAQGETIEGEVVKDIKNNLVVIAKGFSGKNAIFGDKVTVQIRKK